MAANNPVALTRLDAVNQCLLANGQQTVASLDDPNTNSLVQAAVVTVDAVLREVQMTGEWDFNSEEGFPIEPSIPGGFIYLPINCGRAVLNERSFEFQAAWRGGKLYDKGNHTFTFTKTVYVDLVLFLPYEDCPPPIRWYIAAYAARRFATGRDSDTSTYKFTKGIEDDAYQKAREYDDASRRSNLAGTNPHFAEFRRGR